jgi:hypothetical protein
MTRGIEEPDAWEETESREELLRGGRTSGALAVYVVVATAVAIAAGVVAIESIDHWSQWLVLGMIAFTTLGFMIAVSPNRK